MSKTLFHYLPLGSVSGSLLTLGLTLLYGWLASLRSLYEFFQNPYGYFVVKNRTGKIPKLIQSDRYGAHRFLKTSANVKLHYVSAGDGDNRQLMLFVHGFPECWFSWRHQIDQFSQQYHTVAVNMRGYGDSDKPTAVSDYAKHKLVQDIVDVIRTLINGKNNQKCILVAHDWGGAICWTVAAQHPELVDRFIALNAPHPTCWAGQIATNWKQFFASWYMFYFNFPFLPELSIRSNDLAIFDRLFGKFSKPEEIEVYKYYFSSGGTKSITAPLNYYRAVLRGYGSLSGTNQKHIMAHLNVQPKTLVIWGKDDAALVPEMAMDSVKLCRDAQLEYIEHCSHWVQIDQPAKTNEVMSQFLQQK